MVKIFGLATNIDHSIYRARAAEHPATRIEYGAVVYAGIGLGLEPPGQLRVIQQFDVAGRNMDQRVPIAPARFEQHDARARILAQPVRQHAPRRARPDDHVIRLHDFLPPASLSSEEGTAQRAVFLKLLLWNYNMVKADAGRRRG